MSIAKFKLVVEISGSEVFNEELDAECVNAIAQRLQDESENTKLFGYLAKSSSSEVRSDIAYKDNLDEETIQLLSEDTYIEVRRKLCNQTTFREWASTELLLQYIKSDVDCAKEIARNLDEYSNADADVLAVEICKHSDPDVRNALAGSYGGPKKFLKQLLSDSDAGVRASAKRSLA